MPLAHIGAGREAVAPSITIVEHNSEVLRDNPLGDPYTRRLPVYLPPGYEEHAERRYPVVWVLAPFTSWGERFFNLQAWDENIVQRMDRLVMSGQAAPAILAFPDAFTTYGGSQYVNSPAVGHYEDYVIDEMVPFVDANFRTLPERDHRAVLGYSSGGFGALRLAMEHPTVFGAAASHSGDMLFEACYWPNIPGAVRAFAKLGGPAAVIGELRGDTEPRDRDYDWFSAINLIAMSACYSPNPDAALGFDLPFDTFTGLVDRDVWARWAERDPVRMAPQRLDALRSMHALFFDCGLHDEFHLFLGARRLHQILVEHGVDHVYDEFSGGHRNINWRYDVSLPLITGAIAQRKG